MKVLNSYKLLRENGCSMEWKPSVSDVQSYSGYANKMNPVVVWNVIISNCDPVIIQSKLDEIE